MSATLCEYCQHAFPVWQSERHAQGCGTAQARPNLSQWAAFVQRSAGALKTRDHVLNCEQLQNWVSQSSPAPSRDDLTYALAYHVRWSQLDACEVLIQAGADINGKVPPEDTTCLRQGCIAGEDTARFVLLKGGRACAGEVCDSCDA